MINPYSAITQEDVMFFDTDCGGVMHNLSYLRMIETCRCRLTESLGLSLKEMSSSQIFCTVARTEVDYKSTACLGDKLIISGWVESFKGARFNCQFEIKRQEEETLLCACTQVVALVKMPEGRPLRLPKEWKF